MIINTLSSALSPSFAPTDSLFDWLANPPSVPGFPPTLGPPPTAPVDLSVTAVLYSVHLAFHHFKAAASAPAAAIAAGVKSGGHGGGGDGLTHVNLERNLLFLAPRAYVEQDGLRPGALASGAAAAGLRAVFKDLRDAVKNGVPGLEGSDVRVNLVAVGEVSKSDGINKSGISAGKQVKVDGVLLEEDEGEKHDVYVDAVMRVVRDGSLNGELCGNDQG